MTSISQIVARVHQNAKAKGFYEDEILLAELHTQGLITFAEYDMLKARLDASRYALIGSENSEGLEAVRNGDIDNEIEELADVVIRVCDYAGSKGYDLELAILEKMDKNEGRPRMHGGKRL